MTDYKKLALECAAEYVGTPNNPQADERYEEAFNNMLFCTTFDNEIMCCESCGWWVGADEIDIEGNCEDCSEHGDNEP